MICVPTTILAHALLSLSMLSLPQLDQAEAGGVPAAGPTAAAAPASAIEPADAARSMAASPRPAAYRASAKDSICGLDSVSQLSSPMSVRYDDLMDATPERARMRREKIDPASPLGEILENGARTRVRSACQRIMRRQNHCSAWKKIEGIGGRCVKDRTADVLADLAQHP